MSVDRKNLRFSRPLHFAFDQFITQGVSGRTVIILGDGSMDYSEEISSYKHVSNFQWV
jgi:hypothetical protein